MKRHLFTFEIATFSVILLFFVVPPFFVQQISADSNLFSEWSFPVMQTILAVFAGVLCYLFYEPEKKWLRIFPGLFVVCLLFCTALVIKSVSVLLGAENIEDTIIKLPQSPLAWIFCLLNFLFAGFYEEALYRMYFPEALFVLLQRKIQWKFLKLICEIAGCTVFAFAHLYLGWLAVINAAFAHLILRWCYKTSGNIWSGVCAHVVYNVISLILL